MSNFLKLFLLAALLLVLVLSGLALAADQKTQTTKESGISQATVKPVQNPWQQRLAELKSGKKIEMPRGPAVAKQPLNPNSNVNVVSVGNGTDKTSESVSASELVGGEFYALWTEAMAPGPGAPSMIGTSWSPGGGLPGTWAPPATGPVLPPPPAASFFAARHPSLSSHPFGGYIAAYQAYGTGPGGSFLGGSSIWSDVNFGGGGPWNGFGPAALVYANAAPEYVDYPQTIIDDWALNPAPELGSVFYTWTDFIDGDGDPNLDGNPFNDPADASFILYSYSNTLGTGPPPYPAMSPVIPVSNPGPPSQAVQSVLDVVSPAAAGPLPPGALFCAWTGAKAVGTLPVGPPPEGFMYMPMAIYIDASIAPGAGAPFGFIPGAAGANVLVSPVVPIGPLIGGGTQAMSTVSLAIDNTAGPNCTGDIYVAWSDNTNGDPDIFFSRSPFPAMGSPGSWIGPVRVNQDAIGNGRDQWHPWIHVADDAIYIVYQDRRNDPGNFLTETWVSTSDDGGLTWTDYEVSDAGPTSPISTIPPGYNGDYIGSDYNSMNGWGFIWNDGRVLPGMAQDVWFENCSAEPGDANADGAATLADVIAIVNRIFNKPGWPFCCQNTSICWISSLLCRGDWDGVGGVTLADVIRAVNYIFNKPGGPWTPIPVGTCCLPVP